MKKKMGMVLPYIQRYMESDDRKSNPEILLEMSERFAAVTSRQLMEVQEAKASGSYPSGGATKCKRQNALKWLGVKQEPIDWKTKVKFWLGDVVEIGVLGLIAMAWRLTPHSIGLNNERCEIEMGTDLETKATHGGYPDALINFNHEYHIKEFKEDLRYYNDKTGKPFSWCENEELLVGEVKSMADYPFNGGGKSGQGFRNVGPDDTFGYLGQINNYLRHLQVRRYLYVAMWKDAGEVLTHMGVYNNEIGRQIDRNHDEVFSALDKGTLPDVPNNSNHGFDRNGRLALNCRFCPVKKECWKRLGYKLIEKPGRPYMGKPTSPQFYVERTTGEPTLSNALQDSIDGLR